jgi:hypothetical protein
LIITCRQHENENARSVKNTSNRPNHIPGEANNYHYSKGIVKDGYSRNNVTGKDPVYSYGKLANVQGSFGQKKSVQHNGDESSFFERNMKLHRNSVLLQGGIDRMAMQAQNEYYNRGSNEKVYSSDNLKNQQMLSSPNPVSKSPLLPKTPSQSHPYLNLPPYINVPPYVNHFSPQRNYGKYNQLLDTSNSPYAAIINTSTTTPKYK